MICPARIDVTSVPPICGSICNPDAVGLAPLTVCKNKGTYVTAPNITKPMIRLTTEVIQTEGFTNSRGGRTGSLARCSTQMKAASEITEVRPRPRIMADIQGYVVPP